MVTIYEKTAQTFDTLGLGALLPVSCVVTEELNGAYELAMEHPYDAEGKWQRIERGRILLASTPERSQPFRIYSVKPTMEGIRVNARHIFYDLLDNLCEPISYTGTAAGALAAIQGAFAYAMPFSFTTDISGTGTLETGRRNPIQVLLSEEDDTTSFVQGFGGELLRDGFSVTLKAALGQDRDVAIRYGKNLIGLEVTEDESDVKTRILCCGKNGSAAVDSPRMGAYLYPKIYVLEDDNKTVAELREEAQALFAGGADLPLVNLKVDFVPLAKTAEYREFALLEEVRLGDIVTVINQKMGFAKRARVIAYQWNCLLEQYDEVELGDFMPTLATSVTSGVRSGSLASAAVVNASAVMAALQAHLQDKNNPHNVTAAQVGGSTGGTDTDAVQQNLNAHINDVANPHNVTAAQVGTYTKQEIDEKVQNIPSGSSGVSHGTEMPNDADGQDGDVYVKLGESAEYMSVEYIESSGTQYIDTGFRHNQNTRVLMDIQAVSISGNVWAFEGRNSISSARKGVLFYDTGDSLWNMDFDASRLSFPGIGQTDRLYIDYDKNKCTINGVEKMVTTTDFQSTYNLTLLAANTGGVISGRIAARLYSCKIYDSDTLVRDFIPVKDPSGVACLYDKVSKGFYRNAGTGAFAAGAELPKEVTGGALYIKRNGTWVLAMKGVE